MTSTQLSPEAENIYQQLIEYFSEVLEDQPCSPSDVMSGLVSFVSKTTELLTFSGMVPQTFPDFLAYNLKIDFDYQKAREDYGEEVIPLIKDIAARHFNGTLHQN